MSNCSFLFSFFVNFVMIYYVKSNDKEEDRSLKKKCM